MNEEVHETMRIEDDGLDELQKLERLAEEERKRAEEKEREAEETSRALAQTWQAADGPSPLGTTPPGNSLTGSRPGARSAPATSPDPWPHKHYRPRSALTAPGQRLQRTGFDR